MCIGLLLLTVIHWMLQFEKPIERPTQTVDVISVIYSEDWRDNFCIDLLKRMGQPQPSKELINFCWSWTMAEDVRNDVTNQGTHAAETARARFNPLNTTQIMDCETQTFNSHGVRGYSSYECGMKATVITLNYGYYTGIVEGIVNNDPVAAYNALLNSKWCSGCYRKGWPQR